MQGRNCEDAEKEFLWMQGCCRVSASTAKCVEKPVMGF